MKRRYELATGLPSVCCPWISGPFPEKHVSYWYSKFEDCFVVFFHELNYYRGSRQKEQKRMARIINTNLFGKVKESHLTNLQIKDSSNVQ